MKMPLLAVERLGTQYRTSTGPTPALADVSFTLERGTSLGVAGESGCGKSTLALSLMGLARGGEVTSGRIVFDGQPLQALDVAELDRIRWERIALVPQAAINALDPVYRVGDQIVEAIRAHRPVPRRDAADRARALLASVGLGGSDRAYPHEMSGGMRQRAVIAMALALEPDLVIADEPTTALDTVTQAQIIALLRRLQRDLGGATIVISHDLAVLAQICDCVMVMYAGQIVEMAAVGDLFESPGHPYTRALLGSMPDVTTPDRRLAGLPGRPPSLAHPPSGCRFHPRCPERRDDCGLAPPRLVATRGTRRVRCPYWDAGS